MEPPGNSQGTLWEPLEHFKSHLGLKTAQGSQGSQGSVLVVFLLVKALCRLISDHCEITVANQSILFFVD